MPSSQGLHERPLSGFAPTLWSLLSPFCRLLALLPPQHWRVVGSQFVVNSSSLMAFRDSDVGGQPHVCLSSPEPLLTPDTWGTPTEQTPQNSCGHNGTPDSSLLPMLPDSEAQILGGCLTPQFLRTISSLLRNPVGSTFKLYPVSSCFLFAALPPHQSEPRHVSPELRHGCLPYPVRAVLAAVPSRGARGDRPLCQVPFFPHLPQV